MMILSAWTASLSAQITGEQADGIVLERLSREVQSYILYAKEGVQEEMTIATSAGEALELDYPCRVYYASRTGANDNTSCYFIVNESNGNLLEINTMSDAEPEDLEEWRVIPVEIPAVYYIAGFRLCGAELLEDNILKPKGYILLSEDLTESFEVYNLPDNISSFLPQIQYTGFPHCSTAGEYSYPDRFTYKVKMTYRSMADDEKILIPSCIVFHDCYEHKIYPYPHTNVVITSIFKIE